jgi:[protein-PII] uridylyltransferase
MRRFAKVLAEIEARLKSGGEYTFDTRVATYRKALRVEEKWLELQHRRITSGLEGGRMRADTIDDFICHLMATAVAHLRSEGIKPPKLTLMAIGGYGRRELNPKSDVDIAILHTGRLRLPEGVEPVVKDVLNVLFACEFTPGHSTRNLDETVKEANKEMQSKTAMLEARYLWGDRDLFDAFQKRFTKSCVEGHTEDYLEARVADQAARHTKYGDAVYMQEPNIKNGCGGLRDFQNLLWMAYFKYRVRTTRELVAKKYLDETEKRELDRAYDFLFRLRTELHYVTQRHVDVILIGYQKDLADRLGYREKFPDVLRRTEELMRDYYRNARAIYELTELISERLALPTAEARKPGGFFRFLPFRRPAKAKREEFDGFVAIGDQIYYRDRQIFREDSTRMMRLFQHVQLRGLRISPELRQLVRRRLKYINNTFRYLKVNREVFSSILRKKGQVGHILHAMHRVDFLGRWMPEFGRLTALVQHEYFHRYTVDEHTLVCVEKLDGLLDTEEPRHQGYRELFQKLEDPYVLYLALLLHDTGKAANSRHHAVESTINAQKVARRLQLTPEERRMVIFLVDNHDLVARTARQRDLSDPATIEGFAGLVWNQANLDALMLLTVADGLGVGDEKIWNAWTESLAWQLYRQTTRCLADSEGFRRQRHVERLELKAAVVERLSADFEMEIDAHFAALPERYFQTHPAAEIVEHLRLVREFLEKHFAADEGTLAPVIRWVPRPNAGHSELWVCTWDRHQLLARISGALAANELNILSADIFTRHDGLVLDVFRVTTPRFKAVEDERDMQRVTKLLSEALMVENYDFVPLIAKRLRRVQTWERTLDFPVRIAINPDVNPNYTVVDITAPDRLGLLYDILRAVSDARFLIAAARITTEKGAAIDSFYITDLEGGPVTSAWSLHELNRALSQAAEKRPATTSA